MRKKTKHVGHVRLLNCFSPTICGVGQWQQTLERKVQIDTNMMYIWS